MLQFGCGIVWGNPNGGNLANPTGPVRLATIQDVDIEIDQKLVTLMGQGKMPEDIAPSDITIKGKAAFARSQIQIFNALMFADLLTPGTKTMVDSEAGTPSAGSYTAQNAGAAGINFFQDLGVRYASNLKALTKNSISAAALTLTAAAANGVYTGTITGGANNAFVGQTFTITGFTTTANNGTFVCTASTATVLTLANPNSAAETHAGSATTPAVGTYNVSAAGVYTFNTADTAAMLFDYVYLSAAGSTLTLNNKIQGYGPVPELWLSQPYQGNNGLHLFATRITKIGQPMKRNGYMISPFEFEGFADAAGRVIEFFQVSN